MGDDSRYIVRLFHALWKINRSDREKSEYAQKNQKLCKKDTVLDPWWQLGTKVIGKWSLRSEYSMWSGHFWVKISLWVKRFLSLKHFDCVTDCMIKIAHVCLVAIKHETDQRRNILFTKLCMGTPYKWKQAMNQTLSIALYHKFSFF